MTSTIVFDFDGTVAVGNGPVLAYARAMARYVGAALPDRGIALPDRGTVGPDRGTAPADTDFLARVERTLEAFENGSTASYRDGYDVVATLATDAGVSADDQQRAYRESRRILGTAEATVDAAPGLGELLTALPPATHVVLATNAPDLGIDRVLTSWGLRAHFDHLRFEVGKPVGLTPLIREHLVRGPVLSIGDIAKNDLVPAAALGAATALVGATASTSPAEVSMRATTLAQLTPQILAWAREVETPTCPSAAETSTSAPTPTDPPPPEAATPSER